VAAKQLGGVFLCVYVHEKYRLLLKDVKCGAAVTGLLGIVVCNYINALMYYINVLY
jgi:hypothetical protein